MYNGYFILTQLPAVAAGSSYELAARYSGYSDAVRSAVRVDPAGFTLANLGLGNWLPGDENVDGMVDATDFSTWTPSMTGPDNGPIPAGGDLFDFDQDDDVDLHDFQGLQTAAGTSTL